MKLRIKEIRKKRGLTGPQIAEKLNVSTPHYYDMENGKKRIHAEILSKIADILGTSTDYLVGRTNDPSPPSPQKKERDMKPTTNTLASLIEEAIELPEDQQELVAGHWKWALDVVRRQEERRKYERLAYVAEEKAEYRPDLEKLVPRNEINLAKAMVKISNIVYEHNLTKEEAIYLMHRAVDHYGKPEFPEETYVAAHGPRVPGQIGREKEEED